MSLTSYISPSFDFDPSFTELRFVYTLFFLFFCIFDVYNNSICNLLCLIIIIIVMICFPIGIIMFRYLYNSADSVSPYT